MGDVTPVIGREHRWSILVCPDCGEERYGYPCWNCKSGKSGERVAVVPVGDVAQWLDENYGTPDADRFLRDFNA